MLLAQVVEKVSAESFARFLEQNIFAPLGMRQSLLYDETRPHVPNRATSYTLREGAYRDVDYTPFNFIYGEDNVYSTLEDLYAWDQALHSARLVSASALRKAFTPAVLNDGTPTGYGFGWEINRRFGLEFLEHPGAWAGFRTNIVRCPARRFFIAVLSNVAQLDPAEIAKEISRIYLRDPATPP